MYSFHRNLNINYAETSNLSNKDIKSPVQWLSSANIFGFQCVSACNIAYSETFGRKQYCWGENSYYIASGAYVSLKVAKIKAARSGC